MKQEKNAGAMRLKKGNFLKSATQFHRGTGGRQNEPPQITPLWELSPETVRTRDDPWDALGSGSVFDADRVRAAIVV
jgi:hypothetical protein